jgi:hypothetical protein
MALFSSPQREDSARQWKDMSLELKLMFVYHGSMMVLFMTGGALSLRQELVFTAALVIVLTSISIRHRRSAGWRWQGVKSKNLLTAACGVALVGVFLYGATPSFPPSNPRFLPWYLAGFGIGAFGVLQSLRLVQSSEAAFLADCHEPNIEPVQGKQTAPVEQTEPAEASEPQWHRVVRGAYTLAFLAVWIGFIAFFYYSGAVHRDGSPVPTPTQTEPVTEHGKTVYLRHDQKVLREKLQLFAFIGMPSVIVTGPFLHFVLGVKLYANRPTLAERWARRSSRN